MKLDVETNSYMLISMVMSVVLFLSGNTHFRVNLVQKIKLFVEDENCYLN